jgi:hypothetical protein
MDSLENRLHGDKGFIYMKIALVSQVRAKSKKRTNVYCSYERSGILVEFGTYSEKLIGFR